MYLPAVKQKDKTPIISTRDKMAIKRLGAKRLFSMIHSVVKWMTVSYIPMLFAMTTLLFPWKGTPSLFYLFGTFQSAVNTREVIQSISMGRLKLKNSEAGLDK